MNVVLRDLHISLGGTGCIGSQQTGIICSTCEYGYFMNPSTDLCDKCPSGNVQYWIGGIAYIALLYFIAASGSVDEDSARQGATISICITHMQIVGLALTAPLSLPKAVIKIQYGLNIVFGLDFLNIMTSPECASSAASDYTVQYIGSLAPLAAGLVLYFLAGNLCLFASFRARAKRALCCELHSPQT